MPGPNSADLAALMRAAARAADAGDDAQAEPLFQRIVALNPRDAEAWHMLAVIAVRGGRSGDAVDLAKRAQELDRRNTDYLNTLGVAHSEAHEPDQALACFKRALKEHPDFVDGHYNLAKVYVKLGRATEAEQAYLRARRLAPAKGEIAANLATLYLRQGRHEAALALMAEARARLPDSETLVINTATALLARSGPDAAIRELEAFLGTHPGAAAAHAELGRLLLAEGRFADGWREYAWRHGRSPPRFPDCSGKRVLLLPDQGFGDHLFFLRFVPALRERAAHVAFACPEKLFELLEVNPPVDELRPVEAGAEEFDFSLPIGDLPRLLEARNTPPPIPISIAPERAARMRERLGRLGPPPYVGVTWRAGARKENRSEFAAQGEDPLQKEIDLGALASAVRGWRGSVLVLQRLPLEGELAAFGKALGRGCSDVSAVNDDLADMAELLHVMDEYVGVSNTNMHIRAGVGKPARVLIPFPPEFRWMNSGNETPWFPGFRLYRQSPGGDWERALKAIADDTTG
jgi:tetratricopeptide (TPR) repeat protein